MGFALAGRDIADALRFFTRLPVGEPKLGASLDIDRIAWAAPVAGVAVGLIGVLALALATLLGLPSLLRAGLATAALVVATGALHEDGLADVADGFGGGATRARKLEIMRDSRVGAYGAIAIALALILRVGALAAALDGGFWRASLSLMLVAALSRAAALTPLALLPPARAEGAGAAAGRLDFERARRRLGLGACDCGCARPRRAWRGPCAPCCAPERRRRLAHGRVGAPRDRRADRRRRRSRPAVQRDRRLVRASHRAFGRLSEGPCPPSQPSTPCINVCVLDPLSALCIGCGRTAAEITAWSTMSEPERIAVMAGLGQRLTEGRSRAARGGRIAARDRRR